MYVISGITTTPENCYASLDRVEEADIQTQTDAFLDRPPTPLFVPAKTGVDVSTQIVEGDVSGNSVHLVCRYN